jgi:hypothetical protein
VSFESLSALPQFASLRVSLLELLGSSDLPSAADLFFTYVVPRRFDDAVPPHRGKRYNLNHIIRAEELVVSVDRLFF